MDRQGQTEWIHYNESPLLAYNGFYSLYTDFSYWAHSYYCKLNVNSDFKLPLFLHEVITNFDCFIIIYRCMVAIISTMLMYLRNPLTLLSAVTTWKASTTPQAQMLFSKATLHKKKLRRSQLWVYRLPFNGGFCGFCLLCTSFNMRNYFQLVQASTLLPFPDPSWS